MSQKEKTVETLATEADINVKLASAHLSAHLKALKAARLVQIRSEASTSLGRPEKIT